MTEYPLKLLLKSHRYANDISNIFKIHRLHYTRETSRPSIDVFQLNMHSIKAALVVLTAHDDIVLNANDTSIV